MFDSTRNQTTNTLTISRVRNGFILTEAFRPDRLVSSAEPYVFPTLAELYDFLIENDFEVTDE